MRRCGPYIWSHCIGVTINGITVDNDLTMHNDDALDIDSCQQVHIVNCYFSAADDAICLENHGQACAYSASAASGYDRELYAAVEKLRLKSRYGNPAGY